MAPAPCRLRPHPLSVDFTWRRPTTTPTVLDATQVEHYHHEGYLLVEDVIDTETIEQLRDAIDVHEAATEDALRQLPGKTMFIATADQITFTVHLVTRSDEARRFVHHPALVGICHDLVGPDVRLYWDQAVYKKPEPHREFPWHQDNGYAFIEPQQYLTCWVPLTDATVDNGCPWVLPGVHLRGTLEHRPTAVGLQCLDAADGAIPIEAGVGSIVVFSSLTPHRTGPNRTESTRKSYIVQYAPADARVVDGATGRSTPQDNPERQFRVLADGHPLAGRRGTPRRPTARRATTVAVMDVIEPGQARSSGPTYQDLVALDTRDVPVALRSTSYRYEGSADVPKSRYTSPVFAELEHDYVWRRTWQMACREDDLPKPGSHVVYDVGDESLLVTRGSDGAIRAFHNACLHRGTKLRTDNGRVGSFRCPFHAWTWDIDGNLSYLPCEWDFPHIAGDPARRNLPEAKVALWEGFVMVNLDPAAEPFETYAKVLVEHFGQFDYSQRYKAFHAVKEVPANWKVVMEAFAEAYHVIATHPQISEFSADANSEYSIWPDNPNVTRFVNAFGAQSPHLSDTLSEQQIADAYIAFSARSAGATAPALPEGTTARTMVAELFRQRMSAAYRADLGTVSDTEILDAILYNLFPAFAPWAGVGQPLVYRWRPGPTPDTCYMDVIRLAPLPEDGTRPEPAECAVLTLEQSWHEAPGMGGLAAVFEQDMANLPKVQAGLKSRGKSTVTFGNYQEARLRLFHRLIDQHILDGLAADGRDRREAEPFLVAEG